MDIYERKEFYIKDNILILFYCLLHLCVIVFTDPDCPYCKKFHTEMKEIIKKNKDIVFYIKLFPLVNVHPEAYEKSKAILCKNSLKLLDDAIEGKKLPKADCDTKAVDENLKLT